MELSKAIQNRRSVRKFSKKKPEWRNIIECIDSARYAPMAGNNYTLKFILVDEEEKIKKLADSCQQNFISDAQFAVIVCSNPSRTINLYKEQGENFCRQQAGAAIENFLLSVEEYGLSTCWVGYFDEVQIKKDFDIPKEVNIEAIFPIGYETEKPRVKKAKIELDRILYFNRYGNVNMRKEEKRVY